ncbi:MAG: membrane protein insertase YidC [Woeseiaceae bacterium]|nr:membrane protein insertase YidC [Woeseiaceae bacterium]
MDNQRLLIWGFFAIMAYLTWQTWMEDYGPQPVPPAPAVEETVDPLAPVDDLPAVSSTDDTLPAVGTPQAPVDATITETAEPQPIITVRTDVLEIEINPVGGVLQRAVVLQYPVAKDDPDTLVELLSPQIDDLGLIRSWLRAVDGQAAPDRASVFETTGESFELGDDDEIVVPLTWQHESGLTVEKRFTFRRDSYAIGVEQTVTNGTDSAWVGDQVTQALRRSRDPERSMFNVDSYSFDGPQVFDGKGAEKLDRDDLRKETFQITTDDGWVASLQHHFLSAVVPAEGTTNTIQVQVRDDIMTASVIESPARSIAPGASDTFTRTLFVGPKLQAQLREVHPRLTLSVDYGWLTILSQPMFWLLSWIYKFVGNWGWAIIGVTIVIKLVFYRLSESSGRSMAKMRELQPRMKALQDRYKDDRQALSQAMMDLYKREKINPAAGCLPILIQMPFFLAFYWVLVESVEMRQAPFALWITDLSSRDPFFILPLIMGAAMLFQQKLNPAPADPVQARVMQIMPIMFTAFFAFFPSGLVLYWVTNTLLSIAQQWKINKVVHQEALDKKSGKDRKGKKKKKETE